MLFNRWALEEFLRCHRVTRAELAEQADLSPGYVSDLLNGKKKNPTRATIRRIGKVLGIDPRAFYFEVSAEIAKLVLA